MYDLSSVNFSFVWLRYVLRIFWDKLSCLDLNKKHDVKDEWKNKTTHVFIHETMTLDNFPLNESSPSVMYISSSFFTFSLFMKRIRNGLPTFFKRGKFFMVISCTAFSEFLTINCLSEPSILYSLIILFLRHLSFLLKTITAGVWVLKISELEIGNIWIRSN